MQPEAESDEDADRWVAGSAGPPVPLRVSSVPQPAANRATPAVTAATNARPVRRRVAVNRSVIMKVLKLLGAQLMPGVLTTSSRTQPRRGGRDARRSSLETPR